MNAAAVVRADALPVTAVMLVDAAASGGIVFRDARAVALVRLTLLPAVAMAEAARVVDLADRAVIVVLLVSDGAPLRVAALAVDVTRLAVAPTVAVAARAVACPDAAVMIAVAAIETGKALVVADPVWTVSDAPLAGDDDAALTLATAVAAVRLTLVPGAVRLQFVQPPTMLECVPA